MTFAYGRLVAAQAQDPVTLLDVLPIVLSTLALGVSGVVAWRTDRRATRAERTTREVATSALWSDAIEATLRVMSDPTRDDAGDRFQTLGVRLTALVDALPDWNGLDEWLSAETLLAAALRRQVGETISGNPTEEKALKVFAIYADWGHALSNNLRHLRNTGYDEKTLARLNREATAHGQSLRELHGWPEPGSDSNLRVLEDE